MNDNVAGFHCHCPDSDGERKASKQAQKRLLVACILCFLFMIGELMGGYYSGSLAIMSDAAHMFSDVGSFCISLFVIWLSGKGQRKTMTFGYYRAEALGALATVIIIWYITGILTYLAIQRIKSGDFEIEDDAMIGVAAAAVLFNITLGLCLNGMCFPGLLGEGGPLPGGFHGHSHGGHSRLQEEQGDVEVHSEHSHATGRTFFHDKKKVFHQFYREENEETRTSKGSGLGLFLVKKLIEILLRLMMQPVSLINSLARI